MDKKHIIKYLMNTCMYHADNGMKGGDKKWSGGAYFFASWSKARIDETLDRNGFPWYEVRIRGNNIVMFRYRLKDTYSGKGLKQIQYERSTLCYSPISEYRNFINLYKKFGAEMFFKEEK